MKKFNIIGLNNSIDRSNFNCNSTELNDYFKNKVSQDVKRNLTKCYIIQPNDQVTSVLGYYTLASTSVLIDNLPVKIKEKLPRYPLIPAVLLGRLAVDCNYQNRGLGGILLVDAIKRIITSDIGSYAIVVDAKEQAKNFYLHFGFIEFKNIPNKLFLPLCNLNSSFNAK